MQYKKLMQKIIKELNNYKQEVDEAAASYTEEKAKHEEQLQKMAGVYTENYITEERQNWKPKVDYRGVIDLARETHRKIAMNYFDKIKSEIDEYFQIPVDSGFAATITAVKNLNITLSNAELKVLEGAAGGFWGLRLLNEAGISRTKTEQRAKLLDSGEMKRVEEEVKIPYGNVKLPSIEKTYDALKSLENAIGIALDGYCGENFQLKEIIFPKDKVAEENQKKIAAEYGTNPPKQTMNAAQISKMATSLKCFDENYRPYVVFAEVMDSIESTIPKKKKKETLTKDDKMLIDTLIDGRYESLARDKAKKIASADKRLAELLALDERYATAVQEVLREVGEYE